MELLSQFNLSPYRIYVASRKLNKGIATFPEKRHSDYLEYSVDFSKRLQDGERILCGGVTVNNSELKVEAVVPNGPYLTAFVSGGGAYSSHFLTFVAQTNLGTTFIQEMILFVVGNCPKEPEYYKFLALRNIDRPPNTKPPANAVKINNRYLLNDSGFFIMV